jgi:hypothetical protein
MKKRILTVCWRGIHRESETIIKLRFRIAATVLVSAFCLLISSLSFGQGLPISGIAFSPTGILLPFANVNVCSGFTQTVPCPIAATIYSNIALTSAITQPLVANAYGNYLAYGAPGAYTVEVSAAGYATQATPVAIGASGALTVQTLNNIPFADQFVGDACAKIAAAITALPAAGGTIDARGFQGAQSCAVNPFVGTKPIKLLLGAATFTVPNLVLAVSLSTGTPLVQIVGSGPDKTIFIPSAINTPIFSCAGNVCDNYYLGEFSVKSHASGSTGPLIETSGFRSTVFDHIQYLSNGTGNANSMFHLASTPYSDYANIFKHTVVVAQTGPTNVFLFDNGGTGNGALDANIADIENPWIYSNTGITTIFNAQLSALVHIHGGDVEANTGATVLIPGLKTIMDHVWLENNATISVQGATGGGQASQGVVIRDNEYGSNQTIAIQATSCSNWEISGTVGGSGDGTLTVTDACTDGSHNIIKLTDTQLSMEGDNFFHLKNLATGGGDWALDSGATGGILGTGQFGIYDSVNSKFAAIFTPNTEAVKFNGSVNSAQFLTTTNCGSAASPAVCGSAAAGSVVIAAAGTSVVVNTTAVTAKSQIIVQEDQSLGSKLSVTCNTGFLAAPPVVSARSAGTSFTISISAGLAVNPVCFSYNIIN